MVINLVKGSDFPEEKSVFHDVAQEGNDAIAQDFLAYTPEKDEKIQESLNEIATPTMLFGELYQVLKMGQHYDCIYLTPGDKLHSLTAGNKRFIIDWDHNTIRCEEWSDVPPIKYTDQEKVKALLKEEIQYVKDYYPTPN